MRMLSGKIKLAIFDTAYGLQEGTELLAPKVADFTKALDKARQFENRVPKQTGSALSWYLKARSIHPQSKLADDGAKRLVQEILPSDDSAMPTAEVGDAGK